MESSFWQKDIELMKRDELEKLQLERLKQILKIAALSPFYGKRFNEHKIDISKIKSLSDLKHIPFTTKDDLRISYPYGMLCVPLDDVVRLHASSGTTGKSTVIFHTRKDIDEWSTLIARCMTMTGVRKGDVFQNMMSYGLFTGGLGFHYGAEKIGVLTIPAGSGNTAKQVQLIEDFETTVVHITPSYALFLGEYIKENGMDPKGFHLKIAFFGAEPYSESTRKKLEETFNINAYDSYGLSEMNGPGVSFECQEKNGMHIWEDNYIVEHINPQTGEPAGEGEKGELVLTTINREAMPILRYRSKDLCYLVNGECKCGRVHQRISRIIGRSDDMLIVRGVNIFPSQIEHIIMNIPEVGSNYQIILDRENYLDKLTVKVELYSKMFHGDMKQLKEIRNKITRILKDDILVTPNVELLEPGSLPPSSGKAVRVIDNRKI